MTYSRNGVAVDREEPLQSQARHLGLLGGERDALHLLLHARAAARGEDHCFVRHVFTSGMGSGVGSSSSSEPLTRLQTRTR